MTVVFLTAAVGVNVFRHFCSHCHTTYYSVDMSPIDKECTCEHDDCECTCGVNETDEHCGHTHHAGFNKITNDCSMHSHEHEFIHIDDSYNTPEKITTDIIFVATLLTHYFELFNEESQKEYTKEYVRPKYHIPDILSLNCTLLC